MRHITVVHTLYYTDPVCPWSWAFEPSFRRLLWEFDGTLEVSFVMSGMRRDLEDPKNLALQTLNASEQTGMPADVRLWLEDPPDSSHPACTAVKAAAEQGVADTYLRRLREGFFCRRRKLDTAYALAAEAQDVQGIDLERFRIDLRSHAILEAFGADLERAQGVPAEHHAKGSDRIKLPSLEFRGADGEVHGVYGYTDYEALREAALAAGAAPANTIPPSIEQALKRFGTLATTEVAAVCQLAGPPVRAELWRMAGEWRLKPEPVLTGELWRLA